MGSKAVERETERSVDRVIDEVIGEAFEHRYTRFSSRSQSPDLFEDNEEENMPSGGRLTFCAQSPDLFSNASTTPSDVSLENDEINYDQDCTPDLFLEEEAISGAFDIDGNLQHSNNLATGRNFSSPNSIASQNGEVIILSDSDSFANQYSEHLLPIHEGQIQSGQLNQESSADSTVTQPGLLIQAPVQNENEEEQQAMNQNEEMNASGGLQEIYLAILQNRHENGTRCLSVAQYNGQVTPNATTSRNVDLDQTFLGQVSPANTRKSNEISTKIENLITDFLEKVKDEKSIDLTFQFTEKWTNHDFDSEILSQNCEDIVRRRKTRTSYMIALIFYLLGEIYEMILLGRTCTVRELYYRNVELTHCQENVSQAIKIISCLLQREPWKFGVFSTSKGLIAGPIEIILADGSSMDCSTHSEGVLLPHSTATIKEIRVNADFILVVEKDTVFKKLMDCDILQRLGQRCILMTGKGYPDMNTRMMLKKFDAQNLPIYVLTDADPYGVEIMLTYRYGSSSISYNSEALAVASIRWIGIFPSDIERFGIRTIPMTAEDNNKVKCLLKRPGLSNEIYQQLLILNRINQKAEIEGVSSSSCSYLIDVYLKNKIENKICI